MARLNPVNPETATGKAKELLDEAQKKLGGVPNLLKTFANSPAVLEAYLGFSGALAHGKLRAKVREQIALTVGQANDCDYCLSAHSAFARSAGLNDAQIEAARRGTSDDGKTQAALRFASDIVDKQGFVTDDDLAAVRDAGYGDGEIAEIVAAVALNIFTNYFNHVADTEVDFPKVAPLEGAGV